MNHQSEQKLETYECNQEKSDISTIKLVKKAQQLLQSVDEILKNSDSIASHLNKCENNDSNTYVNEFHNSRQLVCKQWTVLEYTVSLWGAQILLALEALHQQEVVVLDLKLDNILIDEKGHAQLTYITPRRNVELSKLKHPYCAPEICTFSPIISATPAADIWSYGVIIYELLTGIVREIENYYVGLLMIFFLQNFEKTHSRSFNSHSIINIPNELSHNAKSLLFDVSLNFFLK